MEEKILTQLPVMAAWDSDSGDQPVDTQGSSVVDKAFHNSLLGSKSSTGHDDTPPLQHFRFVR